MLLLVVAFLVSLVPSIALFLWLRNAQHDEAFGIICNRALAQGALSILPVIACSASFSLVGALLTFLVGFSGIPKEAWNTIVVLAFSEELVKYLWFRRLLARNDRAYSWLDYAILMTIVGIGFGLAEDIPYALGTNAIQMLVRGIDIGHGGYGFLMGYFMGKAEKTGNRAWQVVGFGLPWLMHGLYDFGLSEQLLAAYDWVAIVPVSLALISVGLVVVTALFVRKARNNPTYTTPLPR